MKGEEIDIIVLFPTAGFSLMARDTEAEGLHASLLQSL